MYHEVAHRQSLLRKKKSEIDKFTIKEYTQRGENPELKLTHFEDVTGLEHAINRATVITNIALNGRSISVLEIRKLRETMELDLIGWRIIIERRE